MKMNKFLNWSIALLLPALCGCGTNQKAQDVPEEIYACPMPTDDIQDEPVDEPIDTTNNIKK